MAIRNTLDFYFSNEQGSILLYSSQVGQVQHNRATNIGFDTLPHNYQAC